MIPKARFEIGLEKRTSFYYIFLRILHCDIDVQEVSSIDPSVASPIDQCRRSFGAWSDKA